MGRRFEEFAGRGTKSPSAGPRVTLQKSGKLSLNDAAVRALGNPKALVLLYDTSTKAIGLRVAPRQNSNAYSLGSHGMSGTRVISARAFAKHYGIDLSRTRSFDATLEDGVLVIELDKGFASGKAKGS